MACKKKINLKFIQNFDLFGKEPGLYYKGKEKKVLGMEVFFQLFM